MLTQQELEAAPKLMLGGREFPMPLLAPRQQRIVVPKLMGVMNALIGKNAAEAMSALSTQTYDDLCDLVYVALTRGTPDLKKDDFLDLPIGPLDLVRAIDVVAIATGVLKRGEPGAAQGAGAGEATAGNIGIASSPA